MATEVIAPLDRVGDVGRRDLPGWRRHHRARLEEAYRAWCEGGWNRPLPRRPNGAVRVCRKPGNAACTEMWNGASMAFGV